MLIKEVQQPSNRALFEALDRENDSGLRTEDLLSIVREQRSARWSQPMTGDELSQLLEGLRGQF
jgi:hypothetical protein